MVGSRAHIERSKGTDEQNRTYCSKSGDFIEFGTPIGQGRRSDLDRVVQMVKSGTGTYQTIAEECPREFIKFHKGIKELLIQIRPPTDRDFKTEVSIFVGEPGSGKSKRAYEEAKAFGDVYYKPRGDWWDGYHQQQSIIIDDFYGWIKYDELLKITDRYPYRVPIKGGYEIFNSRRIYITSNNTIDKWYTFSGYEPSALTRRIDLYIIMNKDNNTIIIDKRFDNVLTELGLTE